MMSQIAIQLTTAMQGGDAVLKASITVDDPSVPISIDAEAIAEAVRGVVGMDIDLRVIEPGEEDAGQ